ncbi:hypothetical protein F7232_04660 [Corynebacterium sp. 319]|nr:hypothetical protein F7232_04660 [Corynebacterium sp. 319]
MHSNTWLRFIEGVHGGQHTTNDTTTDEAGTTTEASDDTDTDDTVDYKAKYEAMKKHSRGWETRNQPRRRATIPPWHSRRDGSSGVGASTTQRHYITQG